MNELHPTPAPRQGSARRLLLLGLTSAGLLTGCAAYPAPSRTVVATPPATPVDDGSTQAPPLAPVAARPLTTSPPGVANIATWKPNAAPAAWAGGRIFYNVKDSAGVFSGWSSAPDGSGAVCITCGSFYPSGTQQGVSDATPDGRYVLTTVERAPHAPFAPGLPVAAPGAGAYNDLWLQTADGSHAWRIVNLLADRTNALIWARFDSTGTRVVWSEQWQFGIPFGAWTMHTATLTWSHGVPSLTNIASLQTAGLMEAYGFTPDGSHVLFAADALADTTWDNLQIMTVRSDLTGTAVRLSPHDRSDTGYFSNYNEFAFTLPGSTRIIFGRSVGAYYGSLEYWTMNADGSDPEQLTSLSRPWSSQYHGYPSLVGGLAFDPKNPLRFVAGKELDTKGNYTSLMITLTAP